MFSPYRDNGKPQPQIRVYYKHSLKEKVVRKLWRSKIKMYGTFVERNAYSWDGGSW